MGNYSVRIYMYNNLAQIRYREAGLDLKAMYKTFLTPHGKTYNL